MRVSEGVPKGRFAELYHPEMFQENEEVIVFTRDEFSRFYNSMQQQIDYVNDIDLFLDRNEEWKLLGYWPKVMERLHIVDINIDTILKQDPLQQSYLDAALYGAVSKPNKPTVASKKKVSVQLTLPI
jgi:hypothetical protein